MGLLIDQFIERTVDPISTCPALPIIFWLSVIHTIYSAVLVVFPRLAINGNASILYFSDVAKTDLRNFTSSFGKLKKADFLNHVLSQVHATATIATIKFIHVRRMLIGILVQTGLLLLLVILEAI